MSNETRTSFFRHAVRVRICLECEQRPLSCEYRSGDAAMPCERRCGRFHRMCHLAVRTPAEFQTQALRTCVPME